MPPQWTPETMERAFAQRGRQIFAKARPKSGPSPRNDWISEETWLKSIFFRDVRRRQALLLKCVLARWRASKDSEADVWKATCDRLCRADDAVSRSIRLQIFAFHETGREAACLVKRDRVAWSSEQTKHIAGQLALGRTTLLGQLVRRISGRKRMGPRLVAALKDEEGKVISTPEAAAATWERKFGGGVALASFRCACDHVAGKGCWPDALPEEFLRAGGVSLLPHLARLAARAMAVWVPKSWRGGRMAPIPKKAMLPFTLQNTRGVMCANVAGKVVVKAVRSKLVGPLEVEAGGRQYGAVPRGGTEFPFHRMLAGFSSKKLRGRDALRQCFSRTWPALSILLFRSWLLEIF